MSRPNLLFVTPSLPSPVGTGSMVRGAMTVDALTKRFRVHVLNLNLWSWAFASADFVRERAASYTDLYSKRGDVDVGNLLDQTYPGLEFAAIHTYKLLMARVTVGLLPGIRRPYLLLDLDDDECARSTTVLNLLEADNDPHALKRGRADQAQLRMLEKMLVPRFDAICLAARKDCRVLEARYPCIPVHHLPNVFEFAPPEIPDRAGAAPTLLFAGSLSYAPNVDGICYFCERILPLIQTEIPVSLKIVGADPLRRVALLDRDPAVTIHADVPSMAPYYQNADLCIVPLRAGSGTRIKILEAFRFRRPVVSTRLGAEGLDVVDGEHLLLADEPEAMARACVSLLKDQAARERMADAALAWVLANHSLATVEAAIDSIYSPVLA